MRKFVTIISAWYLLYCEIIAEFDSAGAKLRTKAEDEESVLRPNRLVMKVKPHIAIGLHHCAAWHVLPSSSSPRFRAVSASRRVENELVLSALLLLRRVSQRSLAGCGGPRCHRGGRTLSSGTARLVLQWVRCRLRVKPLCSASVFRPHVVQRSQAAAVL